MMLQSPAIMFNIYKEHQLLKRLIRDHKVDVVISDNRFGLWSRKAYSVYITHQLMIKAPEKMRWAEPLLYRVHGWFINHYDECWIPDYAGEKNLSGDLSHQYPFPQNGHYIGILSRFENFTGPVKPAEQKKAPDLLIMLSGPEPQRTILENVILKKLVQHQHLNVVILQGLPGKFQKHSPLPGVTIFNHLPDAEIIGLINHSGVIICRPGYSTIMDLVTLGRNAVLVPTPGQTEQEYLARHLSTDRSFYIITQDKFNLSLALQAGLQLSVHKDFRNDLFLLAARITGLHERFQNKHPHCTQQIID